MHILWFFLTFIPPVEMTRGTEKVNFIALDETNLTLYCSADIEKATTEKECAAACLNKDNKCSAFQFNETYCTCWKYVRQTQFSEPAKDLYIRDTKNFWNTSTHHSTDAIMGLCNIDNYCKVLQLFLVFFYVCNNISVRTTNTYEISRIYRIIYRFLTSTSIFQALLFAVPGLDQAPLNPPAPDFFCVGNACFIYVRRASEMTYFNKLNSQKKLYFFKTSK